MRGKTLWDQAEQSDGSDNGAPEEAPTFARRKRPRTAESGSDVESLDDYESSSEESESEGAELADKVRKKKKPAWPNNEDGIVTCPPPNFPGSGYSAWKEDSTGSQWGPW